VIALQDAIGSGDITGTENGKTFPPLTGAFLYLAANNTGGTFTSFSTPRITITDTNGSAPTPYFVELYSFSPPG
jgi:hypothetical protein